MTIKQMKRKFMKWSPGPPLRKMSLGGLVRRGSTVAQDVTFSNPTPYYNGLVERIEHLEQKFDAMFSNLVKEVGKNKEGK